jgi:DNA-dependent RNA polymerase auxiliary subunit epsilon
MWEKIYQEVQSGIPNDIAIQNQHELYDDICILSAASGSEIDRAKKMFDVDTSKMLATLKKKYGIYTEINGKERFTKPLFFRNITLGNGYSINPNQHYRQFETSMDYLQKAIDKFRADKIEAKNLPFCEIIKPVDVDWSKVNSRICNKVYEIINNIKQMRESIQSLYVNYSNKTKVEKLLVTKEVGEVRGRCVEYISNIRLNDVEMYMLLREIDKDKNAGFARVIFDTLFATGNADLYEMIRSSSGEQFKISRKTNENSVKLFDYEYFKQKIG